MGGGRQGGKASQATSCLTGQFVRYDQALHTAVVRYATDSLKNSTLHLLTHRLRLQP